MGNGSLCYNYTSDVDAIFSTAASLTPGRSQGINPELDCVVRALAELGEGGERRRKDGWLTVLTALMQVCFRPSLVLI